MNCSICGKPAYLFENGRWFPGVQCEHAFKKRDLDPHREEIINESNFSHLRQYLGRLKKQQWMTPYYKRWWNHWNIQKYYVYFKDDDSATIQLTMV